LFQWLPVFFVAADSETPFVSFVLFVVNNLRAKGWESGRGCRATKHSSTIHGFRPAALPKYVVTTRA
jgi:hypothetical protein